MKLSKKITKRHMISIVISFIVVLLVALNIYRINYTQKESTYMAEKGVLDLSDWDMDKDQILSLDGEWEFYSGKLIDPTANFDLETKEFVKVPGDWKPYLKDEGLENGSGTYRLSIKVPKDMVYGIKSKTMRTSHTVYINNEKILQAGNPSTDKEKYRSQSRYQVGGANSFGEELELVIHITSLNYRSGGIIKALEIGSLESVLKSDKRKLAIDVFVVGICLTLSLYFLAIYLQRKKEIYLAYFSGSSFFMGLYLLTMNEQVLSLIYDYTLNRRTEIQITSIILIAICFSRFTHEFFRKDSNKRIVNTFTIIMLSILSISLLSITKAEMKAFGSMQIVIIISIILAHMYMFFTLIKVLFKRSDSLEYILMIIISITSYWTILFIKVFLEIDLGNTPVYLILLMMFSVAALMSDKLQLDYQEAQQLTQKFKKYDELKDEFFEKASYQFKGTLETIFHITRRILEGQEGDLNISQQESLFKVNQETEGLRRIADDLLDISLISKDEVVLLSAPTNIYKSVEDVLKEIEILIPHDDSVIIKNDIAKDFPLIKADVNKFIRIVHELMDNSIKYTKSGQITISADQINGQAEIKVKDTGIGIARANLKEVFNMFFQKNELLKSNQSLGIGLHIVKKLVEIQGGKIYVESIHGEGTTFTFTLPLYTEEDKKNEIASGNNLKLNKISSKAENDNSKKEKILIIEDEKINQKLLEDIVRELNYETILVDNGKQALEILEKEKIDLVILDFMLSDMTSDELCKQIRKKYSMGEIPILILTSSGRTIDLIKSFNYGVNDFQRKPVDSEELKSRIQSLLLIKASAEEGLEKEFQYFYSQISPHFLYNTLNSIIGLSYIDEEKARQALNNLSVYLRGKLDIHRKIGFVTLESELELVIAYLEIEELRYGERLQVVYNIDEELEANLPPLTLQPIVENAVYHGISSVNGGKLEITSIREEDGLISITIEDFGKGMTLEQEEELLKGKGKGIGFKNVMERIKILKGASLTLTSILGQGTKVKITIPEVKKNENNFD